MPADQVSFLAKKEGQPLLKDQCLLFEKRPCTPLPFDAISAEADDALLFGNDGEDDDFDPDTNRQHDVPLLYDAAITQDEVAALSDASLSSSDSSSTVSFDSDSDDDSILSSTDPSIVSPGAVEPAIAMFKNSDTPVKVRIQPPSQEVGAPEKERGANKITTQEKEAPDPPHAPHTYSLRDRDRYNLHPSTPSSTTRNTKSTILPTEHGRHDVETFRNETPPIKPPLTYNQLHVHPNDRQSRHKETWPKGCRCPLQRILPNRHEGSHQSNKSQ